MLYRNTHANLVPLALIIAEIHAFIQTKWQIGMYINAIYLAGSATPSSGCKNFVYSFAFIFNWRLV